MIIPKKTVCDFCGRKVGINCRYYIIKSKNVHDGFVRYEDNLKHHVCYLCYIDLQKYMRKMIQTRKEAENGEDYRYDIHTAIAQGKPYKEKQGKWILVSERLPDEKDNYWISVYDGTYTRADIGTYYPDKERWSICDANGFYWAEDKDDEVIAWQPLPEPYKEADNEQ